MHYCRKTTPCGTSYATKSAILFFFKSLQIFSGRKAVTVRVPLPQAPADVGALAEVLSRDWEEFAERASSVSVPMTPLPGTTRRLRDCCDELRQFRFTQRVFPRDEAGAPGSRAAQVRHSGVNTTSRCSVGPAALGRMFFKNPAWCKSSPSQTTYSSPPFEKN